MKIEVAIPGDPHFQTLQNIVLEAHLHFTFGDMSRWVGRDEVKAVAVAYQDRIPVGAAMVGEFWPNDVGVFVKSFYRRQGIGRALLEAITKYHQPRHPWRGDKRAYKFYQALVAA